MSEGGGPLRVTEVTAAVRDGRVSYSWRQDGPNPLQHSSSWSISFDGVDLAALPRAVLWDVFWTLQLPVWQRLGRPVTVAVGEPVPERSLAWWLAYHEADDVTVQSPTTSAACPGVPTPTAGPEVAVSYGGGKDSALALNALLEGRDPQDLLLVHVVQHFSGNPLHRWRFDTRSRRMVVAPAHERTGVPTQVVTTDFIARLTPDGKVLARPHVNLYTAALLPALLHHGVRSVTVSRTAVGYRVARREGAVVGWANPSGRPERMRALQRYYRTQLGVDLRPESTHYALGEYVSFGSLLRLYPEAFGEIVMCMRTADRRRWCLTCSKCLEHALFSLALGAWVEDFDYDAMLTSPYVSALAESVDPEQEPAWHGNLPYRRDLGTASHFAAFCHSLYATTSGGVARRLGPRARANLAVLRRAWGRRAFPAVAGIDPAALAVTGPLGREVAERAKVAFPRETEPGRKLLVGNGVAHFAHGEEMPLPRLDDWFAGSA